MNSADMHDGSLEGVPCEEHGWFDRGACPHCRPYAVRQAKNGRWQVYKRRDLNQRAVASYGAEAKARRSAGLRNRAAV